MKKLLIVVDMLLRFTAAKGRYYANFSSEDFDILQKNSEDLRESGVNDEF